MSQSDSQLSSNHRDWRCEECGSDQHVAGWPRRCWCCVVGAALQTVADRQTSREPLRLFQ